MKIRFLILQLFLFLSSIILADNEAELLKKIKEAKHDTVLIQAHCELLEIYNLQKVKKTMYHYNKAIGILEKNKNDAWFKKSRTMADIYNYLGNFEQDISKEEKGIESYIKAISILEKHYPATSKTDILVIKTNISFIYIGLKNTIKAKLYLNDIKKELDKIGFKNLDNTNKDIYISCTLSLAQILLGEKKLNEAFQLLDFNLKYFTKMKDSSENTVFYWPRANTLMSTYYTELKDYHKANYYAYEAYKLVTLRSVSFMYPQVLYHLGKSFLKMGKLNEAEKYLLKYDSTIYSATEQSPISDLSPLIELYEKKNEPQKVIFFLKKQTKMRDSIYSLNMNAKVHEINTKYETEKKEKQLLELEKQKQIQELELEKQNTERKYFYSVFIAAILIVAVLLLTVVLVTKNLTRIKHQKNIIESQKNEIERSLQENKILLKEIHHRVKNNLTVIVSLLEIQAFSISDSAIKSLFDASCDRIRTMAHIHQQLFSNDSLTKIDLQKFMGDLILKLNSIFNNSKANVKYTIANTDMDVETAITIGLIINELFTNSYKYALDKKDDIEIEVTLELDSATYTYKLIFRDNGVGINGDINTLLTKSMGLRLIKLFSKQLDGDMTYRYENGAVFEINFKDIKLRSEIN